MPTKRRVLTFTVLVSIACATNSACDSPRTSAPPAPPKQAAQEKNSKSKVEKMSAEQKPRAPGTRDHANAMSNNQRLRILDLSVPPDVFESVGSIEEATTPGSDDPLSLFADKTEEPSVKVRGRFLLDKDKDPSLNAVDGGQIIIEVPTH